MPQVPVNDTRLYIEDTGGPGAPVLFSHGLLYSCRMWDAQVPSLRGRFRCISFDHRGQGQSAVTAGDYDMDRLAEDAAALIGGLGVQPVHFVGHSMGAMVGMRVAARHRSWSARWCSWTPPPMPSRRKTYRATGC